MGATPRLYVAHMPVGILRIKLSVSFVFPSSAVNYVLSICTGSIKYSIGSIYTEDKQSKLLDK